MLDSIDRLRLTRAYDSVKRRLLHEQTTAGNWLGELSTSALSTATAVMALWQVQRARQSLPVAPAGPATDHSPPLAPLINRGLRWLVDHQNPDGGWGDTTRSFSNISTTMLGHAVLVATTGANENDVPPDAVATQEINHAITRAAQYIDQAGGIPALIKRYGRDKTFSIPILTHCALAGLVDWRSVSQLPFELAGIPARFYKTVRLPVVSYALPALIAIGQVRHHFAPTWNPVTRALRHFSVPKSLRVLERIQPPNGGFLEATPLTSFVTMSLAAKGLVDHPVVRRGIDFIVRSVRPDGSWPIDTNLATWVTTLAVNALGDDLPPPSRLPILDWLLDQQYQELHPYTNADPGGWAWTDLPGGVPDADDTPGAILALMQLRSAPDTPHPPQNSESRLHPAPSATTPFCDAVHIDAAIQNGVRWLLGLQNRDGGFPTFCRGWGKLPFDRSSPDISAHCLRALWAFARPSGDTVDDADDTAPPPLVARALCATDRVLRFLKRSQNADGSWLPLWFGNQHAPDDINPTYGTAKVVAAFRDCGLLGSPQAQRGLAWLRSSQNPDGGWGAGPQTPSSVEETSLATEALLDDPLAEQHASRGLQWLIDRAEAGSIADPAPIGFYFAKLWYFERLYPLIFAVACLRRGLQHRDRPPAADRVSCSV